VGIALTSAVGLKNLHIIEDDSHKKNPHLYAIYNQINNPLKN